MMVLIIKTQSLTTKWQLLTFFMIWFQTQDLLQDILACKVSSLFSLSLKIPCISKLLDEEVIALILSKLTNLSILVLDEIPISDWLMVYLEVFTYHFNFICSIRTISETLKMLEIFIKM
jgi:hypothetical protein